jgi:hypothetical protein
VTHPNGPTYDVPEDASSEAARSRETSSAGSHATILLPDGSEPAPPAPPSCPCGGPRCFYDGLTIASWRHDR